MCDNALFVFHTPFFSRSEQFGPRLRLSLHVAAHWFPDAAFKTVPASASAVSGLGGRIFFTLVHFHCICSLWPTHRLLLSSQEHRNLSQLPNFAFSTALCHFHLSQQEDVSPEESDQQKLKADQMLQDALIMFPGGQQSPDLWSLIHFEYCGGPKCFLDVFPPVLMPLLDLCTVQPDASVTSHTFFGTRSQIG